MGYSGNKHCKTVATSSHTQGSCRTNIENENNEIVLVVSNTRDIREVKLHVYFSRERQKGNFYRLPFIAQYVKVSQFHVWCESVNYFPFF